MGYIFIALILCTILIPSVIIIFESKKRKRIFYVLSIIFFSISVVVVTACSVGLSKTIKHNNNMENYRSACIDFSKDYQYYYEISEQYNEQLSTYEELNGNKNGFNFYHKLDEKKLTRVLKHNDTFESYFYRNYAEQFTGLVDRRPYYEAPPVIYYEYIFYINTSTPSLGNKEKNYLFYIRNYDNTNLLRVNSDVFEFSLYLENSNSINIQPFTDENVLAVSHCIIMIVLASISAFFNIISFIVSIKKTNAINVNQKFINENNSLENNKLMSTEHPIIEKHVPEKPKWSALKDNEKQPYIEKAIKELFIKQLAEHELTRQEKALKQYSIDKNEFYIEDLNDEDKKSVLDSAKQIYENDSIDIGSSNTKNTKNLDGKLIKKGFKWVPISLIGKILGKVTSFTGEKSPYDFRYLNFGMKLVVSTLWEGYKIEKDDVLKYSIKQSSGLKERCIITLKNGKKISVDLNIGASEKVIMALGADLMDE